MRVDPVQDPTRAVRKPRVLVVYYSRTGNTEAVARGLARAADADVEAIADFAPRKGLYGYLRCGYEGTFARTVAIARTQYDPRSYDLVLIGSPTWNSALSSPVRAYLAQFKGELPDVGLFATCGGRGAEQVLQQMTALLSKPPLATLSLRNCDLRGRFAVYLSEFWERLLSAWERGPAVRAQA